MNETPQPSPPATPPASAPPSRRSCWYMFERTASVMVLLLMLVLIGLFALMVAPGPLKENQDIIIPHGTPTRVIAAMLDEHQAIYHPLLFRIAAKAFAYNALQAGEYQITAKQSIAGIILMLHGGHSIVHRITVAEGLTSADIVRMLNQAEGLTGDPLTAPAEGDLMPETYLYTYGDNRHVILDHMQKAMQDMVQDLWQKRDPSVPLTDQYQAVIMASVIEKETGKVAERPRIAGVFYNRLHIHMRLQSDPTVIYAIVAAHGPQGGALGRELQHDDLAFSSPINTYVVDGLPSQPICNPGRAALEAALHPETNDYLYFVADGTGGHVFSRSLAEHNQNVMRWNAIKDKAP